MSATVTRPASGTRLRGFSSATILLFGVLLVPVALSVITTSHTVPDEIAHIRMAFASVAGSTMAIGTVVALLFYRIIRRSRLGDVAWFTVIALVVTAWQASSLSRTADVRLTGLAG